MKGWRDSTHEVLCAFERVSEDRIRLVDSSAELSGQADHSVPLTRVSIWMQRLLFPQHPLPGVFDVDAVAVRGELGELGGEVERRGEGWAGGDGLAEVEHRVVGQAVREREEGGA